MNSVSMVVFLFSFAWGLSNMLTNLIDSRGSIVSVGDVVKCLANEPWVFVGIIDENTVQVMWEESFYDMPTLAIGCKVVKRENRN